jgi:hypothetical protein
MLVKKQNEERWRCVMKKNLMYLALVMVILSLTVFGTGGGAPQDVAAKSSIDSPIYTVWCDYDGPDAVVTPYGSMPASHVHFVPNDSIIKVAPEGDYIYSSEDKLTEFAAKETEAPNWLHRVDITKPESVAINTITPEGAGSWQNWGWIEYTYTNVQSNLAGSVAEWNVPGEPPVVDGQAMGLFNGYQDTAATFILQPVLQWGVSVAGGDPDDWTGVPFAMDGDQAYYGPLINCNVGNIIKGVVDYFSGIQEVYIENEATGQYSRLQFWGLFPTSNVVGVVALEGHNFGANNDLPGNTLFKNVKFLRINGSQIKWPTMTTVTRTYGVLTNLGVDVFYTGALWWKTMNVRLRTANDGPDW